MWNAVASLQYAAGLLPLPGAGYLASLGIISNVGSLVKTSAQLQAQVDAIVAHYEGECAAGWPSRLASICPRGTPAAIALKTGTVPLAFYGGNADLVIPPRTQVIAASADEGYVLEELAGAGHVRWAGRQRMGGACTSEQA